MPAKKKPAVAEDAAPADDPVAAAVRKTITKHKRHSPLSDERDVRAAQRNTGRPLKPAALHRIVTQHVARAGGGHLAPGRRWSASALCALNVGASDWLADLYGRAADALDAQSAGFAKPRQKILTEDLVTAVRLDPVLRATPAYARWADDAMGEVIARRRARRPACDGDDEVDDEQAHQNAVTESLRARLAAAAEAAAAAEPPAAQPAAVAAKRPAIGGKKLAAKRVAVV